MLADITFLGVVWYVVAGFVIGLLARAILPGKQHLSLIMTLVLGVVSAVIGGFLWDAIFSGNEGVAWIGSIIVAVVILFIYERVMAGREGGARTAAP
jgi:uncharacterized membrane protein YeaQ/YmgE (transglycosylase-associated protein family)